MDKRYRLKFIGRPLGAIGETSPFTLELDARDEGHAWDRLYETHEHIRIVSVSEISQETPPAGDLPAQGFGELADVVTEADEQEFPYCPDCRRYHAPGAHVRMEQCPECGTLHAIDAPHVYVGSRDHVDFKTTNPRTGEKY